MYSIVLDYGKVSEAEEKNIKAVVDNFSTDMTEGNAYTDEYMGEMLYAVGKLYFSQLDIYNEVVAGVHNVTTTRSLSLGVIGFNANVTFTFGVPSEIKEGGIFLDIGHDVHCIVSNDNNNESEKKFMLEAGMYASAMEHGILEQVTGIESVSTIKALQYAQQNNVSIHYITKDNLDSEVAQLTFSEQLISDIRSSVNSGKVIIIPEHEITIHQWTGVGYMVLDPETFACGYMISGGMAGGAMAWYEVLWETAKATATSIFAGFCIAFYVWLFPPLIVPVVIAGIIGYALMLYSIGSHMYNAVLHDDVREFQEAMIESSSFMLTTAFFLGLSKWLDIDSYEEAGGESSGEGGSEGKSPVEEANGEAEAARAAKENHSSGEGSNVTVGKPARDILPDIKRIEYGENDLSQKAINFRKTNKYTSPRRNVCVVEYEDANGELVMKEFISNKTAHSEDAMIDYMNQHNITGDKITRIFTEREPCVQTPSNPAHDCAHHILDFAPDAEVTYAYDYGVIEEEGTAARADLAKFLEGIFGE